MIVPVEVFNAYSGNYEDSPESVEMKKTFLLSAEEIVSSYLSYHPEEKLYSDVALTGMDRSHVLLPTRPIKELVELLVDGVAIPEEEILFFDDRIRFKKRSRIFKKESEIIVAYKGGWNVDDMPAVIRLSIMRIATLMLSETGGNIGLTGKSFADNSRTFINYSNYKKYLEPLDGLRIVRF